jgi:hypothetical protein
VVAEELLVQLDCIFDFFVFNDFLELLLEIREKSNALSKIVLLPILTEVIGVALRLVISLSELQVGALIRVISRSLYPPLFDLIIRENAIIIR